MTWKFPKTSEKYWDSMANQRTWFDWVSKELKITKFEDWYKIKTTQMKAYDGSVVLERYLGSLSRALMAVYPEYLLDSILRLPINV
jgi:hypothetical protein